MDGEVSTIPEDFADAVRYEITHETRYEYSAPVVHGHHLLHLTPRDHAWQHTLQHEVQLLPRPSAARIKLDRDAFGNAVQRVELDRPHQDLSFVAHSQLLIKPRAELDAQASLSWERVRDDLSYCSRPRTQHELEVIGYRFESPHVRLKNVFSDYAEECFPHGRPILVGAEALMQKLYRDLTYTPGVTDINTSLLAVLETRRGVCQDYAHLMLACLRSLGLAARYVSGYLRTLPPEGGVRLVGADASHAWVSVYTAPYGWVDLDPTNGIRVNTDHLTLGWGRDFSDVSPVRGVIIGGGQHTVSVAVTVTPLDAIDAISGSIAE